MYVHVITTPRLIQKEISEAISEKANLKLQKTPAFIITSWTLYTNVHVRVW